MEKGGLMSANLNHTWNRKLVLEYVASSGVFIRTYLFDNPPEKVTPEEIDAVKQVIVAEHKKLIPEDFKHDPVSAHPDPKMESELERWISDEWKRRAPKDAVTGVWHIGDFEIRKKK